MWIGLGIALLVIGGIFSFGIRDQWSVIDLTAIGYICMAAGVLAIILSFVFMQRRRTAVGRSSTTTVVRDDEPPVV